MVMCLTLFAIAGRVDKDGVDGLVVDEKPAITCFYLRHNTVELFLLGTL